MERFTVGVEQENGMCAIAASMIIVDRMVAVQVRTRWDSVRIAVPDCTSVISSIEHAVLISAGRSLMYEFVIAYNGSVCSPRPYKLGLAGSFVLSLKY